MHAHKERCIHVCNVETRSGMIALADSADDEGTLIKAGALLFSDRSSKHCVHFHDTFTCKCSLWL